MARNMDSYSHGNTKQITAATRMKCEVCPLRYASLQVGDLAVCSVCYAEARKNAGVAGSSARR